MIWLGIVIGIFLGSFLILLAILVAERNTSAAVNCTLSKIDQDLDAE